MTTQYQLSVTSIETVPSGEFEGAITSVAWNVKGTRDGFSAIRSGVTDLPPPNHVTFVPLPQTNMPLLVSWVTSTLGPDQVQSIKDAIEVDIEEQMNPKKITITPTWL